MSDSKSFLKDSVKELKKVHWPDKPKVVETSLIVVACMMVFAVFLWGVDLGLITLFSSLLY